jgi:hypothetical protein
MIAVAKAWGIVRDDDRDAPPPPVDVGGAESRVGCCAMCSRYRRLYAPTAIRQFVCLACIETCAAWRDLAERPE